MAQWDGNYESIPTGFDFGSSTSAALRSIKTETHSRFSLEHSWDDAATPECIHKLGLCTIVEMHDGVPSPHYVIGALLYDYTTRTLYRDTGLTLVEVSAGLDHTSLLNLTDASAHTLYVAAAGDTVTDITIPATKDIKNLDTLEADYNDVDVMECSMHINADDAPHDDETVTAIESTIILYCEQLKLVKEDFDFTPTGHAAMQEWIIGRGATLPFFESDSTDASGGGLVMLPLFSMSPPDDWEAGFTMVQNGTFIGVGSHRFHMSAYRIDEA
jgi:hypothetical protein